MIITADGNHALNQNLKNGKLILYVSGEYGGATASLSYVDSVGSTIPLTDGELLTGQQYQIDAGKYITLFATVTGASGTTAIEIKVTQKD